MHVHTAQHFQKERNNNNKTKNRKLIYISVNATHELININYMAAIYIYICIYTDIYYNKTFWRKKHQHVMLKTCWMWTKSKTLTIYRIVLTVDRLTVRFCFSYDLISIWKNFDYRICDCAAIRSVVFLSNSFVRIWNSVCYLIYWSRAKRENDGRSTWKIDETINCLPINTKNIEIRIKIESRNKRRSWRGNKTNCFHNLYLIINCVFAYFYVRSHFYFAFYWSRWHCVMLHKDTVYGFLSKTF